jgi:uncharacterized protein (DUF58 family)
VKALVTELRGAGAFVVLAGVGWGLSSDTFALLGALGALALVTLHVWQRYCLTGLTYSRRLDAERAGFGDEVGLEIEIVNDKILPLSYVQIDDDAPAALTVVAAGGVPAVRAPASRDPLGRQSAGLVQVLPLLPYQRVRQHLVVRCDRRGDHRLGPSRLTSGDPVGRRARSVTLHDEQHLLVYPKIFALLPEGLASRMLVGATRSHRELESDPSRITGVRAYEQGDPLRHVDWRATARVGSLLVRQFEPTVAPKVAIVLDVRVPQLRSWLAPPDELELLVATVASLLAHLVEARTPVGLYANGSSAGQPVAYPASGSAASLTPMLEALARLLPYGAAPVSRMLAQLDGSLARQTSILVVSTDFSSDTVAAMAQLRRRHAVSAILLETGAGREPPRDHVDALLRALYVDDWHGRTTLELHT